MISKENDMKSKATLFLALFSLVIALTVLNYSMFLDTGSSFSLHVSYFLALCAGIIAGLGLAAIMDK